MTSLLEADARFIVTLDGPAGTGKSSTAQELARRLGFHFLDTGAMYRAAVVIALSEGLPLDDGEAIAAAVRRVGIDFDFGAQPPRVFAGEREVTTQIRGAEVSALVSPMSALPPLRRVLVEQQRRLAAAHSRLVTEGRDQGTVVFPDAAVKLYLEAAASVRAARRAAQLRAAGHMGVDEAVILADIVERDHRDSTRADSPLRCPDDAVRLDTSGMSLEEVVDELERIVRDRLRMQAGSPAGVEPHDHEQQH